MTERACEVAVELRALDEETGRLADLMPEELPSLSSSASVTASHGSAAAAGMNALYVLTYR